MTEPNEQYAYFTITGDFNPAEISNLAGVAPTECWLKGEVNPRTHLERKFSRWSLYSRLDKAREIEAHIEDVIEQLTENKRCQRDLWQLEALRHDSASFRLRF